MMTSWIRKGFAALVAAGFLLSGGGQAQAVLGIPDDVPANTLLFPAFVVNPNRNALRAQDTLVVVTNTSSVEQRVHFVLWDVRSRHQFDFNVILTANDVFSCSLYNLLVAGTKGEEPRGCANGITSLVPPAPSSVATFLTVDGELRGYVTADVVSADPGALLPDDPTYPFAAANVLIGHLYLVDLPAGSSTGINAVSIEDTAPTAGHPALNFIPVTPGFYSPDDALERIDGASGKLVQYGGTDTGDWYLLTRYFSASALNLQTLLWLWADQNNVVTDANVIIYDEEERGISLTLNFPFEVNVRDIADIVSPGIPGGWLRIPVPFDVQAVAYSLQLASAREGLEVLRWDALFPAHRQYTSF